MLATFFLTVSWGALVGLVFSSIGAAGGILASFGLISVLGISDANSVKPMAQILTLATAMIFIPSYWRSRSWVFPLGLLLSAGGIVGALLGSTLSSHYLADMSDFRFLFGFLALIVALQIAWKLARDHLGQVEDTTYCTYGVTNICVGLRGISFDYCDKAFSVGLLTPFFAGFAIAIVASVFGVGGGFLLVPFLSSVLGLPMYIVPATAAIAVFISGFTSVSNYLSMGSTVDVSTLALLIVGGIAGSVLGPRLNRLVNERALQLALLVIVSLIGVKYLFE